MREILKAVQRQLDEDDVIPRRSVKFNVVDDWTEGVCQSAD